MTKNIEIFTVTEGSEKPEDKEETVPKVTGVSVEVDKPQMAEPREEKAPEVEQKKEKPKIGKLINWNL